MAKTKGRGEAIKEEGAVEGLAWFPGVEAEADLALTVVESTGDEVTGVRDQIDLVAIGGLTLERRESAGEDPGMSAVEGTSPFREKNSAHGEDR